MVRCLVTAAMVLATIVSLPASAQEAVYIIRHAEKETSDADPRLTDPGRERAVKWADMLRLADLDAVITSDARRTRETGGIVAGRLDLPQKELPADDVSGVIDLIQFDHEEDTVLVVGHAETIPRILSGLGVQTSVDISQDEFANLFIVTAGDGGEPRMIRLIMP